MAGPTIRLTFAGDSSDLERSMNRVGDSAGQMEKQFSAKSAGLTVAGAAAAVGLSQAFASSLEFEDASAKLQAQMGAGTEVARNAGEIAGSLYAQAYGENLGEVNEAVRGVMQSGAVMAGASNEQIESVTAKVMSLAQARPGRHRCNQRGCADDEDWSRSRRRDRARYHHRRIPEGCRQVRGLPRHAERVRNPVPQVGLDGQTATGLPHKVSQLVRVTRTLSRTPSRNSRFARLTVARPPLTGSPRSDCPRRTCLRRSLPVVPLQRARLTRRSTDSARSRILQSGHELPSSCSVRKRKTWVTRSSRSILPPRCKLLVTLRELQTESIRPSVKPRHKRSKQ